MKLQTATRLALYAILELASQPDAQLSRAAIAGKFQVSSNHLSKVMRELGKAGMVEAARGVGGGYRLACNPKRTTLLDIIRIFEPSPFEDIPRAEPGADTDIGRSLDLVLAEINDTISSTLESISISTMVMLKEQMPADTGAADAKADAGAGTLA